MKHIVEAGTDAASLLLFDPKSLPDDFDSAYPKSDVGELLGRLDNEGRIFWINTEGDGGYLLHAFLEESVPSELSQYIHDPIIANEFEVASGQVYFAGAEYAFRDENPIIPGMGGSFNVPVGKYEVTLFRAQYPDDLLETTFAKRATRLQKLAHGVFGWLVAAAIFAILSLLVGFFVATTRTWLTVILPTAMGFVAIPIAFSQLPVYRSAQSLWREINMQFPSFVAVMIRFAHATPKSRESHAG